MKLTNTHKITTAVLATLACASFGCSGSRTDRNVNEVPAASTYNSGTTSGTTVAANDESAAPAAAPAETTTTEAPAASTTTDTSTTTTKTAKKAHVHKVKKHHMKHEARVAPVAPATRDQAAIDHNARVYDNDADARPALPASPYYVDRDDTISGTTMAAPGWRETGLSPFAQEPASRIPTQIGSGQITGEDRSTTVMDRPGLFQDEAAFNRDQIH